MNRRSFFGTIVGLVSIPFIKSKVLPEPKLPPVNNLLEQCAHPDPATHIPAQHKLAKALCGPLKRQIHV